MVVAVWQGLVGLQGGRLGKSWVKKLNVGLGDGECRLCSGHMIRAGGMRDPGSRSTVRGNRVLTCGSQR